MNQVASEGRTTEERGVARIVREFDFPRETVFRMLTDPKRAVKWFGTPDGQDPVFFELEARPGGKITIHDQQPEGPVGKTSGTVLDIVEPERFTFKSITTLHEGAVPFEAHQTMTFEAISPRRTRLTVVVKVQSAGSFPGGMGPLVEGYTGGWGGSLDKLERAMR